MDAVTVVGAITIALIVASLDISVSMLRDKPDVKPSNDMDKLMSNLKAFEIKFKEGHTATAVKVETDTPVTDILRVLGIPTPTASLFISGGAGGMSDEDVEKTRLIMDQGVAKFAAEHEIIVIDGGTESGVMQMVGEARLNHHYGFPLIGVAPAGKVSYPGHRNPHSEAELDSNHSHFVLVNTDDWGGESQMIVDLTRKVSGNRKKQALGVLINGGKIAQQDIYLATAKGDQNIPILVLEGSGRFAEELATAFRTGYANQSILKAIISGGDIKLLATGEGVETMWEKLDSHFNKSMT